ncbi:MAG: 6-carboxytetrahydropterin synthase QueD [Thermoflavifilum sp.]|nr:6-carboxytetrahydropterin synthase QueD [Thermoflavifilum sp.]MCL6514906.1 6-carboxytetrahydropterin synthase QueD [Alicyclobacillus sp.]
MLQQFYPQVEHPYRYELNKDLQFAAAHRIPHAAAGVCERLHGHTYFVNLTIAGDELDETGFLVDFKSLKTLVHDLWDHRTLNDDTQHFSNEDPERFPTTEVVARTIWEHVQRYLDGRPNHPKCVQVIVRETPTSYVIFRPKPGRDLP